MDSTTTGALRVVLNVTDVSAVAEMERMRANTERMMKAYHFQQTMRSFGEEYLDFVNRIGAADNHGDQSLVNILLPGDEDPMLFVDATFSVDDSYICLADACTTIALTDLNKLAEYFDNHPAIYDAFMGQVKRRYGPYLGEYNTPADGIIAIGGSDEDE